MLIADMTLPFGSNIDSVQYIAAFTLCRALLEIAVVMHDDAACDALGATLDTLEKGAR